MTQIIQDYAEYSGISIDQIMTNCQNFQEINKQSFENFGDSFSFYENSDTYIYDLFIANSDKTKLKNKIDLFSPGLIPSLSFRHYGSEFLEFGGGLGVFCEIVKEVNPGMNVTYCDIKSKISDFTLWRYNKHKVSIDTIIIPQEDFHLEKSYDVIFTDAVIEHLQKDQQERYISKLASYVKMGGQLVLLIDLSGEDPNMPMHYSVDIHKLHSIAEESGMQCSFGRNTFSSRWVKIK